MIRFGVQDAGNDITQCTKDEVSRRLQRYISKRDFGATPEPTGGDEKHESKRFVVQEHHARQLHYDFRLEREGVLKSWAVPKGLPTEVGQRRLAIETEDHPIGYSDFEGTIPEGQYGAGTVKIWDKGSYKEVLWNEDKIEFILNGEKLHGRYILVKLKKVASKNWLILKAKS
jgi:DNA ligase D-like protein (predicted 3'-phosphoesterase)